MYSIVIAYIYGIVKRVFDEQGFFLFDKQLILGLSMNKQC